MLFNSKRISELSDEEFQELNEQIHHEIQADLLAQPMLTQEEVEQFISPWTLPLSQLVEAGLVIALPREDARVVYPKFQFDIKRDRVNTVAAYVNALLGAKDDPWGVTSWWLYAHARLGNDISPSALLRTDKEERLLVLVNSVFSE